MDQSSSSQNPMSGLHRPSVTPNPPAPDYWNNIDSLYSGVDPQLQRQPHQQQQPRQQQPTPLGINWDHPVFHQEPQPRNIPSQQEHSHGIFSSTPQSWQPNPLHHQQLISPSPQGFGLQPQYHNQVQQFPQGQLSFDSRSLAPSDNSPFQPFPIQQNFYPPQHLSVPDTFRQSSSPQNVHAQPAQPTSFRATGHQPPLNQFTLPTAYPGETSHNPINLADSYHEPAPSVPVPDHQTINPQFLNAHQQAATQQPSLHNNFSYLIPADFEQPNNQKPYNFYREDLQIPSAFGQPVVNQPIGARNPGFEVMIDNKQGALAQAKPFKGAEPLKKKPGPKKQPQPKTKKPSAASAKKLDGRSSVSSGSESDSSDESDLEIQLPEEPSPIPPTRPSEPVAVAEYDTLRAVWSPRNRRPNVDKVKSALVAFKDVVKAVRDTWKEITQAIKTAENQHDNDKATKLKNDAALQRRLMDVVVSTTLSKGHPMIVEKLGEHPMAVAAMYSFLLDRHQESDVDGALTVNILKLLARFVTMDEDVLQKTNVAKLLPRLVKKGSQPVKELSQKVLENAAASKKRKQENGKAPSKEGSPGQGIVPDTATTNGVRAEGVGSKRHREGEGNGLPATKRMVVTSNPKSAVKPPSIVPAGAKRPQEPGPDTKATAATASRPKANIIAPKPTNLFGSLSSASKRPGTSNAERAAAAAAAKPSGPIEKKETQPPPPKPSFSFGDLMADLNKQKDPVAAEPAEDKPPETEEERKKRLRKEARRKLRVSWKPEESLTEVRLFTHDPEEELGPGDSATREVGDVKGEGRALKLHRDAAELEEDDDGGIREEAFLDYHELIAIDDGELTADDRSRNCIKRLGTQEPTSPEKTAQDHREANSLMVFWTSPADVPPTPKEPPTPSDDEIVTDEVPFGELPDHVKARQERYFAMVNPKPAPPAQPNPPNNQFDISNLLKMIQSGSQQQQSTPPPQLAPAVQQAPMTDLERTISIFRQQQQQQVQPQPPPIQPPQIPQFPASSQPPAAQGLDFQKILAVINAQKQMPQAPIFTPPPQSQPSVAPNLAAIVSQFANQSTQPGGQQHFEDPERKRMRESNGYDGASDDKYGQPKRNRLNNAPNKKHPKAGLVPCRYWREGKCLKGDDCTFRHDPI
ncbi:hypothetical protein ASPWEDRAFT_407118 [Aspergillus wentii DTO 134E9]|uniref:C3H1-type domain-containing protein n=1 Tax=Aspergillus wentii DTO 134E9 TaxID=1073089 RepID=A0A1L9RNP0_ASPWE|nr:uncharacterized protein ASPWEDRAFT_407118 [Aspergillus wentii DTO 134E9]OJJ36458.1 hypothetical protein ASPWEDRAFT_407118 [Aspergillus wentii DTO 134E9]